MDGKFLPGKIAGPNMDDVPIGEAREDYRPPTIGQGLLDLANWFDIYDNRNNHTGPRTVQEDLRRWASRLMDVPADIEKRTTVIPVTPQDQLIIDPKEVCKFCGGRNSERWWKCCPEHCTEHGPDVVCQTCYLDKHPDAIITN